MADIKFTEAPKPVVTSPEPVNYVYPGDVSSEASAK